MAKIDGEEELGDATGRGYCAVCGSMPSGHCSVCHVFLCNKREGNRPACVEDFHDSECNLLTDHQEKMADMNVKCLKWNQQKWNF